MAQKHPRFLDIPTPEQAGLPSRGYIMDVFPEHRREKPHPDYVFNSDYRLNNPFERASEREKTQEKRDCFAKPHILGSFSGPQSGGDIPKQDGVRIKHSGERNIFIPDYYEFSLPIIHYSLKDALKLYGRDKFENSGILLVVKKSDVEQNEAHRNDFSQWHDHYHQVRHRADLIYTFHTTLPTQFKTDHEILQPPENTILRFGGEIKHRSQINTGKPVERLWGAIIIEEKESYRNGLPENSALVSEKDPLFKRFASAAKEFLRSDKSVRSLSVPIALDEYEGTTRFELK